MEVEDFFRKPKVVMSGEEEASQDSLYSLFNLPGYIIKQITDKLSPKTPENPEQNALTKRDNNILHLTIPELPSIDLLSCADWASNQWNHAVGSVATKVLGLPFEFPVYTSGIVVVTGAGGLLGFHAAKTLALKGFVVFGGVRNPDEARRLRSWSKKEVKDLFPVVCDVTDQKSIDHLVKLVNEYMQDRKLLDQVTPNFIGLVNCEATGSMGPVEMMSVDELTRAYQVNAAGAVQLTQSFLPLLRESKGRVVNMSSSAGLFSAAPANGSYAASKMALEALSDSMRVELFKFNISVSIVEPGSIDPRIWFDTTRAQAQNNISRRGSLPNSDNKEGLLLSNSTNRRSRSKSRNPNVNTRRAISVDPRSKKSGSKNMRSPSMEKIFAQPPRSSITPARSLAPKNPAKSQPPVDVTTPGETDKNGGPLANLYMPMMTALSNLSREHAESLGNQPPSARPSTRAIMHALFSPYPMTRYLCGWDAKLASALKWVLPDRIMDLGFQAIFGDEVAEDGKSLVVNDGDEDLMIMGVREE